MITFPGGFWRASNSTYYWVLDRVAQDASAPLAARLREVCAANTGLVDLEEAPPAEIAELRRLARPLADVARRELPDTPGREAFAQAVDQLVATMDEHTDATGGPARA